MRETFLYLWGSIALVVSVGFVVLCFVGFPPAKDEPKYYGELDED